VEYSLLLQNKEKWFVLLTFNCMDFNATIDIIINDLREAGEIIDDLKNYPGVPQIQVELAKSKCKSAQEIIALLKTSKTDKEPEKEEKPVRDPVNQEIFAKYQNADPDPAPITPIKQKDKTAAANIVADKFSHLSNTYNEQLSGTKNEDDISALMKTQPIENLSDAIGVNDKFLYIRELFGGSQASYDQAIARLNSVHNLPDAKAIIMSYTSESDDNEVVKQLLDLVKRKLLTDG
jgi:hypothetical protein